MEKPCYEDPIAVERLEKLICSVDAFRAHLRPMPVDWENALAGAKIAPADLVELKSALRYLWLCPFTDLAAVQGLVLFRYTELPSLRAKFQGEGNARGIKKCALFELLLKMAIQGTSVFPYSVLPLAVKVKASLEAVRQDNDRLDPFLDLLVNDSAGVETGFNAENARDLETVLVNEHQRREGIAEGAWRNPVKFTEYRQRVLANPRFHEDWKAIKNHFDLKQFRDSRGIIRRTKLPERNWQAPVDPNLDRTTERFQAVFDFFCWKWFLYGMRADEPLVEKLTFTLTPYGTQIFIPGYWSLDAQRDIEWQQLLKLHRARGISRQGEKLSSNKRQKEKQLQALLQADHECKAKGIRGKARFAHLKKSAGLVETVDDAQVRRMLKEVGQFNRTIR